MKKKTILTVMIVLAIVACTLFISDGLTYLVASLMALAIMGTIQHNKSLVMKMTRWGKANPHKAQVLITVLQIALMAIGIIAGYNFKQLGYELSNTTAFVFSSIIVTGFLFVPFLPKRKTIAITKEVNRQRFAFMGIALSSFVMMVLFGNRIEDQFPSSPITQTVKAIDQAIFPDNSNQYQQLDNEVSIPVYSNDYKQTLTNELSSAVVYASYSTTENVTIIPLNDTKKEPKANLKAEKKAKKFEKKKTRLTNLLKKHRLSLAAGLTGGAVLLIILLVIATCAGACLIAGGVAGLINGELLGILGILAGAGIGWLSIKGIGKVAKKDRQKTEQNP